MKVTVKVSMKKQEIFNRLIEQIIEEGRDFSITDGSKLSIYFNTENMYCLELHSDGTWELG